MKVRFDDNPDEAREMLIPLLKPGTVCLNTASHALAIAIVSKR